MKLFIVTGSGGGFGSAILRQINKLHPKSVIVACSRSKDKIDEITSQLKNSEVRFCCSDFSESAKISSVCENIIKVAEGSFIEVYLINNHGIINDVSKPLATEDNPEDLSLNLNVNVISFQVLTSLFLNSFEGATKTVINISSLAAIKPFPSMGLYAAGKATRHMLYKVLAAENPDLNVLNYSPGPMETGMTEGIEDRSCNAEVAEIFATMKAERTWVDCDLSAEKMFKVLTEKDYKSGDQIDFYDL